MTALVRASNDAVSYESESPQTSAEPSISLSFRQGANLAVQGFQAVYNSSVQWHYLSSRLQMISDTDPVTVQMANELTVIAHVLVKNRDVSDTIHEQYTQFCDAGLIQDGTPVAEVNIAPRQSVLTWQGFCETLSDIRDYGIATALERGLTAGSYKV